MVNDKGTTALPVPVVSSYSTTMYAFRLRSYKVRLRVPVSVLYSPFKFLPQSYCSDIKQCMKYQQGMLTRTSPTQLATSEASTSTATEGKSRQNSKRKSIAIIGGGASGIFAAIHASSPSSCARNIDVTVFEATSQLLSKVKISGGGRCNVLHDAKIPTEMILQKGYPRGSKELRSICTQQFPVAKAASWFEEHNVTLKTEPDGRMFPITDSSQTVIDALLNTAVVQNHVRIQLRTKISRIVPPDIGNSKFQLITNNQNQNDDSQSHVKSQQFDAVIVATGSAPAGYALVAVSSKSKSKSTPVDTPGTSSMISESTHGTDDYSNDAGSDVDPSVTEPTSDESTIHHPFVSSVPSLFTFNCKRAVSIVDNGVLAGLAGVSVPKVRVSFAPAVLSTMTTETANSSSTKKKGVGKKVPAHLVQEGPILVTHHGLSGPAILRLSAFGARDMAACQYRGIVTINWIPDLFHNQEECFESLWATTLTNPKKMISSQCPLLLPDTTATAVPKRLWQSLVRSGDIPDTLCWGSVNKQLIRKLTEQLMTCRIEVTSKSTNKDEFVTAGGIDLSSINMKTMQSKTIPGVFFCGELLNVDGITGGFNFYNCWTTGYVAGTSAATYVMSQREP